MHRNSVKQFMAAFLNLERLNKRCYPILLSAAFGLLAVLALYLYVNMRILTASTQTFEAIPTVIVAVQLAVCSLILLLLSKSCIRESKTPLRLAAIVLAIGLFLLVVSSVLLVSLCRKHDQFVLCLYRPTENRCACRYDNNETAVSGWRLFEEMKNCGHMEALFYHMICLLFVYVLGSICALLALLFIGSHWRRLNQLADRERHMVSHAWVTNQSTDYLQTVFAELRRSRYFPPAYEETYITPPSQMRVEAPPPYRSPEATPRLSRVDIPCDKREEEEETVA